MNANPGHGNMAIHALSQVAREKKNSEKTVDCGLGEYPDISKVCVFVAYGTKPLDLRQISRSAGKRNRRFMNSGKQ